MIKLIPKTSGFIGASVFVKPDRTYEVIESATLPEGFLFGVNPTEDGLYFTKSSVGSFIIRVSSGDIQVVYSFRGFGTSEDYTYRHTESFDGLIFDDLRLISPVLTNYYRLGALRSLKWGDLASFAYWINLILHDGMIYNNNLEGFSIDPTEGGVFSASGYTGIEDEDWDWGDLISVMSPSLVGQKFVALHNSFYTGNTYGDSKAFLVDLNSQSGEEIDLSTLTNYTPDDWAAFTFRKPNDEVLVFTFEGVAKIYPEVKDVISTDLVGLFSSGSMYYWFDEGRFRHDIDGMDWYYCGNETGSTWDTNKIYRFNGGTDEIMWTYTPDIGFFGNGENMEIDFETGNLFLINSQSYTAERDYYVDEISRVDGTRIARHTFQLTAGTPNVLGILYLGNRKLSVIQVNGTIHEVDLSTSQVELVSSTGTANFRGFLRSSDYRDVLYTWGNAIVLKRYGEAAVVRDMASLGAVRDILTRPAVSGGRLYLMLSDFDFTSYESISSIEKKKFTIIDNVPSDRWLTSTEDDRLPLENFQTYDASILEITFPKTFRVGNKVYMCRLLSGTRLSILDLDTGEYEHVVGTANLFQPVFTSLTTDGASLARLYSSDLRIFDINTLEVTSTISVAAPVSGETITSASRCLVTGEVSGQPRYIVVGDRSIKYYDGSSWVFLQSVLFTAPSKSSCFYSNGALYFYTFLSGNNWVKFDLSTQVFSNIPVPNRLFNGGNLTTSSNFYGHSHVFKGNKAYFPSWGMVFDTTDDSFTEIEPIYGDFMLEDSRFFYGDSPITFFVGDDLYAIGTGMASGSNRMILPLTYVRKFEV